MSSVDLSCKKNVSTPSTSSTTTSSWTQAKTLHFLPKVPFFISSAVCSPIRAAATQRRSSMTRASTFRCGSSFVIFVKSKHGRTLATQTRKCHAWETLYFISNPYSWLKMVEQQPSKPSHTSYAKTVKPLRWLALRVLLATGNLIFMIFTSGHRFGPFFSLFLVCPDCWLVFVWAHRLMGHGGWWLQTMTQKYAKIGKLLKGSSMRSQILRGTSAAKWHFSSIRRM